jgi:adenylate cyclase
VRRRALQTWAALIVAGLWGLMLGAAHLGGDVWGLDRAEAALADFRTVMRGPRPAPGLVTIIAIDDEAVREARSYPLPRAVLARIVTGIARHEPRAVALDLLFVDPVTDAGDAALAQAFTQGSTVIAAAAVYGQGQRLAAADADGPLMGVPFAESLLLPLEKFSSAAKIGIVNVVTDETGTPRFAPLLFRTHDRIEASMALRAVSAATGHDPVLEPGRIIMGGRTLRTDRGQLLPLNFYGPRGTIKTVSAALALNGQLSRDDIQGRVVIIGAMVAGGGDVFHTPFDPVLPGVEVQATAISHLMANDGLVRDRSTRLADAGVALALPMTLVGLLAWRRSVLGFAIIACVVAAWAAVNMIMFSRGIWLSAALPMAAAAPPAILFGLGQIFLGRRRALRFATQSALLQRFHTPALAKWLIHHPDFLVVPVRQDAAIVFIDLSGFTGLSEKLGPATTRELLEDFYGKVEAEVVACGGVVMDFTGDGAMIVFGLPKPTDKDAANAAECGVRLSACTTRWLATLPPAAHGLGFKIGAHFGQIVASRLGGGSHQQISATGDTVNLANRLMGVAAEHGAEFALSDEMLQAAGHDCAVSRSGTLQGPSETQIRGRTGSVEVWLWTGAGRIGEQR